MAQDQEPITWANDDQDLWYYLVPQDLINITNSKLIHACIEEIN